MMRLIGQLPVSLTESFHSITSLPSFPSVEFEQKKTERTERHLPWLRFCRAVMPRVQGTGPVPPSRANYGEVFGALLRGMSGDKCSR
jgi:hypothetical protein